MSSASFYCGDKNKKKNKKKGKNKFFQYCHNSISCHLSEGRSKHIHRTI